MAFTIQDRIERAKLSLDGLSVGDAFGQQFFGIPDEVELVILQRALPRKPWHYTDDTVMALAIQNVLSRFGRVDQDELATEFGRRYLQNPRRGYGGTAHEILQSIGTGVHWSAAAGNAFSGMGSMGNGGAMRVAPLGAYFADDIVTAVENARLSAEVTHTHLEGQAGAIAVAAAAVFACTACGNLSPGSGRDLLEFVLDYTPTGETRAGIAVALTVPLDLSVTSAASILGNGSGVISQDTVPFALWSAAGHLDNFTEAMWATVSALGDRDTTCAIVGGIVALSAGRDSIPAEWLAAREALEL